MRNILILFWLIFSFDKFAFSQPVWTNSSFNNYQLLPIFTTSFYGIERSTYDIEVSNLQAIPGFSTPDAVMWLIKIGSQYQYDNQKGVVVAFNDDYNGLAPRIIYTADENAYYKVVVASYANYSASIGDIKIFENRTLIQEYYGETFGGLHVKHYRLKSGYNQDEAEDTVFIANRSKSENPYHDFLIHIFQRTFSQTPGYKYQFKDDDIGLLPKVFIEEDSEDGHILIGIYYGDYDTRFQLIHSKLSQKWYNEFLCYQPWCNDEDHDGLTYEVEANIKDENENLIPTCDSSSGPGGAKPGLDVISCENMKNYIEDPAYPNPSIWDPADTDHDGLNDNWEVYGVRICYNQGAYPPYYYPGECLKNQYGKCLEYCFNNYAEIPLSVLGSNPREYDQFIEVDNYYHPSIDFHLREEAIQKIKWTFEVEGLQCTDKLSSELCEWDPKYKINTYIMVDENINVPFFNSTDGETEFSAPVKEELDIFGMNLLRTLFLKKFNIDRKLTNSFKYVVMADDMEGKKGFGVGRYSMLTIGTIKYEPENVQINIQYEVFLHEIGHANGIEVPGPKFRNYLSPMILPNFQFYKSPLYEHTKIGNFCYLDSECGEGNICAQVYFFKSTGETKPQCHSYTKGVCIVNCGDSWGEQLNYDSYARYSRGLLPELNEKALEEKGYLPVHVKTFLCWSAHLQNPCTHNFLDYNKIVRTILPNNDPDDPNSKFVHRIECQDINCSIDWNNDGNISDGIVSADINGDGVAQDTSKDYNDWLEMHRSLSKFLNEIYSPHYLAFYSAFETNDSSTGVDSSICHDLTQWGTEMTCNCSKYNDPDNIVYPWRKRKWSAYFRGKGYTDYIKLNKASHFEAMGKITGGIEPHGFAINFRFKLLPTTNQTSMYLVNSNLFKIQLDFVNNNWKLTGCVKINNTPEWRCVSKDNIPVNEWKRITLNFKKVIWDTPKLFLCLDYGTPSSNKEITEIVDVENGDIYIGNISSQSSNDTFNGYIDDFAIYVGTIFSLCYE